MVAGSNIQFSAQAVQSGEDGTARHAQMFVGDNQVRMEYLEDGQKANLAQPTYTIELTGVEKYSLSVFEKTDEDSKSYPATSSENDYPFLLPEFQVNNLMKDPEEFLEKTNESPAK